MAGLLVLVRGKSRQGRKVLVHGHHFLPSLQDSLFGGILPSLERLGYCQIYSAPDGAKSISGKCFSTNVPRRRRFQFLLHDFA